MKRFWDKVEKTDDCWNWLASKNDRGYGWFFLDGKNIKAHRFSWELNCGEIPQGLYVCHHCDNPSCIRPDHLFLGTHTDNMRDAVLKQRTNTRGERNGNSLLMEFEVLALRSEYQEGVSANSLAVKYKVARKTVIEIVAGRTWQHLFTDRSPHLAKTGH